VSELLAHLATRREHSLFARDVAVRSSALESALEGSRVLVIGGAGSIGAATVAQIARYAPRSLHVVDQNENSLAELVRSLRAAPRGLAVSDFKAAPLDFGSPVMRRFLDGESPYDFVLNFAAIKHVRSEKDVPSLLQMLDTNLLKAARLIGWLEETGSTARYFSVSTDKAANPTNLMGASKRAMEQLLFAPDGPGQGMEAVTSARFANVAFSAGSLLESFLLRIEKRQPVAVPRGAKRFFVSSTEAGEICLLAAVSAPSGYLLVPRLDAHEDLVLLTDIAAAVIKHFGFDPKEYTDEEAARMSVAADVAAGRYPLLLTPLNTTGEKAAEEFVAEGESTEELGFFELLGLRPPSPEAGALSELLNRIEDAIADPQAPIEKSEIISWLRGTVPGLTHAETGLYLDARI